MDLLSEGNHHTSPHGKSIHLPSGDRRRDLLIMETPSDEVTRVRTRPEPSVYSLALATTAQDLLVVRGLRAGVAPDALKELVAAAARRPGRRNLRPRR